MSGAGTVLWQAALAASVVLMVLGWGALFLGAERVRQELCSGRGARPPRREEVELVLCGFALIQIGIIAGIILLNMKGT